MAFKQALCYKLRFLMYEYVEQKDLQLYRGDKTGSVVYKTNTYKCTMIRNYDGLGPLVTTIKLDWLWLGKLPIRIGSYRWYFRAQSGYISKLFKSKVVKALDELAAVVDKGK